MTKILRNPESGASINSFKIKEEGFEAVINLPVNTAVELPDAAADILLESFQFLVEDPNAVPDNIEPDVVKATVIMEKPGEEVPVPEVPVEESTVEEVEVEESEVEEEEVIEEQPEESVEEEVPAEEVVEEKKTEKATVKNELTCNICGKVCKNLQGFNSHMLFHARKERMEAEAKEKENQ